MILKRLEPKNSKKVAVGVPGRSFEVTKGYFSAPRFDSSHLPVQTAEKKVTLVKKSAPENDDLLNSSELLLTRSS